MRYITLFLIVLCHYTTSAQVCEGSLGVNIFESGDFGTGTQTVLLTDPGYAPGYQYATVVPSDGQYTVTKTTAALAGLYPSWLAVRDNSPGQDEYFMVVNASFEPGLFYQEEITDLCENTLYEFSADVINLIESSVTDHIRPNVDFLINGVTVFSTGDIPQTESWITYGFTFVTDPSQTSLTLSLRNNAPGGRGNDLGLDNITFRPCGPNAFVGINSSETTFLCFDDDPLQLMADIADPSRAVQWQLSTDSITWQDIVGATGFIHEHDLFDPGTYYYRYASAGTVANLANVKCSVLSDVLVIEVLPEVYMFRDTICAGLDYNFGSMTLDESGSYVANDVSSKGCDSTTILELEVVPYLASSPQTILSDPRCPMGEDGVISVREVTGGYDNHTWQLDSIGQMPAFDGLGAGSYTLTIEDRFGCVTEVELQLTDPQLVDVEILGNMSFPFGDEVVLEASFSEPVDQLIWSDASGTTLDTSSTLGFIAVQDQVIILSGIQGADCRYSDTLAITVLPPILPRLPNAISPNGDNVNEDLALKFVGKTIAEITKFVLYDRWGNLVASQSNVVPVSPHLLWDGSFAGTAAVSGTYTYYLDMRLAGGEVYQLSGAVSILR